MIALAESVSHGCNTLRYISGETRNKKNPERVYHIYNNLMEQGLDARGIWDSFKLTLARHGKLNGRLKNSVISFVLSPPPDKVKYFSDAQWKQLGLDYLAIYDKIKLNDDRFRVYSEPTNILGSKFTMWLHRDSDSGVPHLHVVSLRIDMNGKTNNDHQILQRAQHAADVLARRRGWQTARQVREEHLDDLEYNCLRVLESMQAFSYDAYFNALRGLKQGYVVETKRDKEDNYVSYVVCDGNKRYPASQIGTNRRLTVAHLEDTWKKLREQELARQKALRQADAKRAADELKTERDELTTSRGKADSKSDAAVQKPCTNPAATSQRERNDSATRVRKLGTNSATTSQQERNDLAARVQKPCNNPATTLRQERNDLAARVQKPSNNAATTPSQKPSISSADTNRRSAAPAAMRYYTQWQSGTTNYDYTERGRTTRYWLPKAVMEYFNKEFDYTVVRNWDELTKLAVGVFVGVVLGPTEQPTVGTGGGGPTSDLPWRDKDEDDLRWARRCAQYATRKLGITKKGGLTR